MTAVLGLKSIKGLAWRLSLRPERLHRLAASAPRYYHPFLKRQGSKERIIDNPDRELKTVQARIHSLLLPCVGGEFVYGAVKGRSPLLNAKRHCGAKCVVRVDIRDFFPSISHRLVYRMFVDVLGCSPDVAGLLTKLTTYRGYLPQGSPASTDIANLVLAELDDNTVAVCSQRGITYTRYINDLVFSGDDPCSVIHRVVECVRTAGFRISRDKLKIQPSNQLQEVTGYSVNSKRKPGVPRHKEDAIRSAIHQLSVNNVAFEREVLSLDGRVRFVENAGDGAGRRLRRLLEKKLAVLGPEVMAGARRLPTSARSSARRRPRGGPSR